MFSSAGCRLAVGIGLIWERSPASACLGTHGGIKFWLRAWGLGLWLRVQHHLTVLDGGPGAGDPTLSGSQLQASVARGLLCSLEMKVVSWSLHPRERSPISFPPPFLQPVDSPWQGLRRMGPALLTLVLETGDLGQGHRNLISSSLPGASPLSPTPSHELGTCVLSLPDRIAYLSVNSAGSRTGELLPRTFQSCSIEFGSEWGLFS